MVIGAALAMSTRWAGRSPPPPPQRPRRAGAIRMTRQRAAEAHRPASNGPSRFQTPALLRTSTVGGHARLASRPTQKTHWAPAVALEATCPAATRSSRRERIAIRLSGRCCCAGTMGRSNASTMA